MKKKNPWIPNQMQPLKYVIYCINEMDDLLLDFDAALMGITETFVVCCSFSHKLHPFLGLLLFC